MLCEWEELPSFIRIEEVRPYYEKLKRCFIRLLVKRVFDFVVSSALLLLLAPVFLLLAIGIKWDSKGPVFYRQERVTQYGRIFRIYKFRTMVQGADKLGNLVTTGNDFRITEIGKKIRRCRLDELPQLINIWRGEMTFVGTRPEVPKYVKKYTPEMRATLLLPAGITSEASIRYKDEAELLEDEESAEIIYIDKILPEKMKYNLESIRKFGLIKELATMIQTVAIVMKKEYR